MTNEMHNSHKYKIGAVVQASLDSPARLHQTAWYSILGSAPDDERVNLSKHVEQENMVEWKIIYKELCI